MQGKIRSFECNERSEVWNARKDQKFRMHGKIKNLECKENVRTKHTMLAMLTN
jgi:hypothetical protein